MPLEAPKAGTASAAAAHPTTAAISARLQIGVFTVPPFGDGAPRASPRAPKGRLSAAEGGPICGSVTQGTMDFGVLGPLEVRDESGPVSLGGDKRRTLLAILLLHANEVASRDRLVD